MPTAASLTSQDPAELHAILQRLGVEKPWQEMSDDAAQYVARMQDRLTPAMTDKEINAEAARITAPMSKRGLLGLARRTNERWTTMEALDAVGDMSHELIRISEGDENTCDSCLALAGSTGTIFEHQEVGLPGSASCDGGDMCRCELVLFK
ncbi:MAG: hypothetical protein GY832_23770 [Chloroflexi bacterium]|nr:hypothetical protein [Chloroflexota bacterium]